MSLWTCWSGSLVGTATVVLMALGSGVPPARAQGAPCQGLSGAAAGLCNAFCEAQDCAAHPRPSCAVLRRSFQRLTGHADFPCEVRCGNGRIDPGEACDPPGSVSCPGGRAGGGLPCRADCSCPPLSCGNGRIDPGEQCEPGQFCRGSCNSVTRICVDVGCNADCTCSPPVCGDWVLDPGEGCDPPGSLCADSTVCGAACQCEAGSIVCGGIAGLPCPPFSFCDFPPKTCGIGDIQGACRVVPFSCLCPDVFDPVCGCDGQTYGNDCNRICAGVSLNHPGPCP